MTTRERDWSSSTFFNGIVRHKDGVFGTLPFNDFSSSASWLSKTSSLLKFHDDGDSWRIIEFSGGISQLNNLQKNRVEGCGVERSPNSNSTFCPPFKPPYREDP